MNVKLTEVQKIKLLNSDDIFEVMQKVLRRENRIDREKEHFWIIGLNTRNKILFIELVSMGGVRSSTVEPMNVYRVAVLKGAVKVILVHNHPGGSIEPSEEDKNVTDRLIQVGKILEIELIEHLIITLKSYLSFALIGLLEELAKSTKWVPKYQLEQKIRAEETKLRKQAVKAVEIKEQKIRKEAVKAVEVKEKKLRKEAVKVAENKGKIATKTAETKGEIAVKKAEIKGIEAAQASGIKGEEKGKKEMAKGMRQKGIEIQVIVELSGLSKKEIEHL